MLPSFNSLPYNSNQLQIDRTTTSVPQKVMPSNQCPENPSWPNSMQIQSQMGTINPQTQIPFNNTNTHMSNPTVSMPNRPNSMPTPSFMNAPNHLFPPNGMPLLGSAGGGVMSHPGQSQGGFNHQNLNCINTSVQGMNSGMGMNGFNPSQPPAHLFVVNPMNMPQFFNQNQNGSMQNGQLYMQSPMQNVYQFVQPQMSHYGQVGPCNPMLPNNVSQGMMAHQSPNFMANHQFGMVHTNGGMQACNQNQHKFSLPTMDVNALQQTPSNTHQLRGNSALPVAFGSVQPQQVPQNFHPHAFMNSQGTSGKDSGIINLNSSQNNSQNQNMKRNPEREGLHGRNSKTQIHHRQNAKGKFGFQKQHGGKGFNKDRARKSGVDNSSNQMRVEQTRSLPLNYTEQEIRQWREERRKNYPLKVNIEKKQMESEVTERCAKLRRQQLKEILVKQAELGCEVAEIPSHYLSDSEKQVNGRDASQRPMTKKERFQNKFNKRGRSRKNDRFAKKKMLADPDSSNVHDQNNRFPKKQKLSDNNSSTPSSLSKKQPTLLQRLLSSDIRRDKTHLLQVFRFMVMNSFFNNGPKEPLRFPLVLVKEAGHDGDALEEKSSNMGRGVSEASNTTNIKAYEDVCVGEDNNGSGDDNDDDDDDNDKFDCHFKEAIHSTTLEACTGKEFEECEEEGEIVD